MRIELRTTVIDLRSLTMYEKFGSRVGEGEYTRVLDQLSSGGWGHMLPPLGELNGMIVGVFAKRS